jgi:hypothetical protein
LLCTAVRQAGDDRARHTRQLSATGAPTATSPWNGHAVGGFNSAGVRDARPRPRRDRRGGGGAFRGPGPGRRDNVAERIPAFGTTRRAGPPGLLISRQQPTSPRSGDGAGDHHAGRPPPSRCCETRDMRRRGPRAGTVRSVPSSTSPPFQQSPPLAEDHDRHMRSLIRSKPAPPETECREVASHSTNLAYSIGGARMRVNSSTQKNCWRTNLGIFFPC